MDLTRRIEGVDVHLHTFLTLALHAVSRIFGLEALDRQFCGPTAGVDTVAKKNSREVQEENCGRPNHSFKLPSKLHRSSGQPVCGPGLETVALQEEPKLSIA